MAAVSVKRSIVPGKGGWKGSGSISVSWAFSKIPYNVYTLIIFGLQWNLSIQGTPSGPKQVSPE